jgi:hypothetical protein
MKPDPDSPAEYASPACFAHELESGTEGYVPVDRQQARDVARWRKAERARLIAARLATSPEERRQAADAVAATQRRLSPRHLQASPPRRQRKTSLISCVSSASAYRSYCLPTTAG